MITKTTTVSKVNLTRVPRIRPQIIITQTMHQLSPLVDQS